MTNNDTTITATKAKTTTTIAILGATSDLAQSVARQLANADTHFYLIARDETKLAAVSADLSARGAATTEVLTDLADLSAHEPLVAQISAADHHFLFFGQLSDQQACEAQWQEAEKGLTVNLLAPVSLLHGLSNVLEARGNGSLVVVSSVAGDRGRASNYWYGTAKGALSVHCQGLRNRLASSGVHVMTVKPGFIDTAMTAHLPKTPSVLWASPDTVATQIIKGWVKRKNVIYTPRFWQLIMWVIASIPESVFKRLSL